MALEDKQKRTINLANIRIARRLEIMERANKIRNILLNKYVINPDNTKNYYGYNTFTKMNDSRNIYKELYKEELKNEEESLFLSYILISDDYNFIKNWKNYGYNLNKLCNLYEIPVVYAELRLANIADLNGYNKVNTEEQEVSYRRFR